MLKRIGLALLGVVFLVVGITLVLSWWPIVVLLFKGIVGMGLALTGMILLYLARD